MYKYRVCGSSEYQTSDSEFDCYFNDLKTAKKFFNSQKRKYSDMRIDSILAKKSILSGYSFEYRYSLTLKPIDKINIR